MEHRHVIETGDRIVAEVGTAPTTHIPHTLCRAAAGPSPVRAGSLGEETPAVAGSSGPQPVVTGCAVPACHAGGRWFEFLEYAGLLELPW
jgi:hypothetical protein